MKDREWDLFLAEDVRIVARRSSNHPMLYAVALLACRDGRWHTVRLFDNSHGVSEHHEHGYIGPDKQPPTITHGDPNQRMGEALFKLQERWVDIVAEWDRTR